MADTPGRGCEEHSLDVGLLPRGGQEVAGTENVPIKHLFEVLGPILSGVEGGQMDEYRGIHSADDVPELRLPNIDIEEGSGIEDPFATPSPWIIDDSNLLIPRE